MNEVSDEARAAWESVAQAHREYVIRLNELVKAYRDDVVRFIELSFRAPMDAGIALAILPILTERERQKLQPLMLSLCSSGSYAHIAKPFILALPRTWVMENIEREAESVLLENDFGDWCNILDLFDQIDFDLARRLAVRLTRHEDNEIRDWGNDYLRDRGA